METIKYILWIISLGISIGTSYLLFYRVSILKEIPKYIALMEEYSWSGKEKMAFVVIYVKDLIPRFLHVVYNDKVIETMAQNIYNDMKSYRDNYNGSKKKAEELSSTKTKTDS